MGLYHNILTLLCLQKLLLLELLLLCGDDMIIKGSDEEEILNINQFLNNRFQMTNLRKLTYFLDIEVAYRYLLSQLKFSSDLINRVGISNDKIIETLETLEIKMKVDDGETLEDPTLVN